MPRRNQEPDIVLKHPEYILMGGLVMGGLFRWMHWPHSMRIMTASLVGFSLIMLIRFYRSKKKDFYDYLAIVTLVVATVNGVIAINYMSASPLFKYLGIGCTLLWVGIESFKQMKTGKIRRTPFLILLKQNLFTVALAITGIGVFLKVFHWPGSGLLIIIGMGIGAIWAVNSGMKR